MENHCYYIVHTETQQWMKVMIHQWLLKISMIHEIDVIRWLLDEDYETAEVVFAKDTRRTHAKLRDPQIMILTTKFRSQN